LALKVTAGQVASTPVHVASFSQGPVALRQGQHKCEVIAPLKIKQAHKSEGFRQQRHLIPDIAAHKLTPCCRLTMQTGCKQACLLSVLTTQSAQSHKQVARVSIHMSKPLCVHLQTKPGTGMPALQSPPLAHGLVLGSCQCVHAQQQTGQSSTHNKAYCFGRGGQRLTGQFMAGQAAAGAMVTYPTAGG
jgi:hypothetical protein